MSISSIISPCRRPSFGFFGILLLVAACSGSSGEEVAPAPTGSASETAESGPGSWAPWVSIARTGSPSRLLIYPVQFPVDPSDRCFVRYTAAVVSRDAREITIALVQQSPEQENECVGEAVEGPPVEVRLDTPYSGEVLVDAATGNARDLRPAGTFEKDERGSPSPLAGAPSEADDYSEQLGFVPAPSRFPASD